MPLPKIDLTPDTLACLRAVREDLTPLARAAHLLAEAADREMQWYLQLRVLSILDGPESVQAAPVRFHMAVHTAVADVLEKAAAKFRRVAEGFNRLLPEPADLSQEVNALGYDLVGREVLDALGAQDGE